jgi:16S rRNA (cytosine967-C5)-methyltransferase
VVSAHFRKHKALGQRERHTLAETAYAVLRQRLLLQHLAQSGSGRGAPAGDPGLAWATRFPARPWVRISLAGAVPARSTGDAAREAAPQPARLAGHAAARTARRRRLLAAGAATGPAPLDLRVNTVKAKREDVQAALADRRASRPRPRRILALGPARQGKPALNG